MNTDLEEIKIEEIPSHSDITRVRFSDADWSKTQLDVIIGGAGTIGSWLALFLGRIGHNLYIYDPDNVSEVNLAGQLYRKSSVLTNKSEEIINLIHELTDTSEQSLESYPLKYTDDEGLVSDVMMSGFDNMQARKSMYKKWKDLNCDKKVFIDARLSMETAEIYCVTPDRYELYEATLFSDAEGFEAPCSAKATSHCGAITAGIMTSLLNNWSANLSTGMDIRKIPFRTEVELSLIKFQRYDS